MQSKRREVKHRGVSRMDFVRAKGWFVRVYRRRQTHAKFFSDGKYEGKAQALQEALAYRAEYERKHPPVHPEDYPHPPFRSRPQRNNRTGVNGVSETVHVTRTGDRLRCFSVTYTLDGERHTKRFIIDEYGSRPAALEEAKQFRKAMEREMWREYKQRMREGEYSSAER
ncbi:MAG TPA: hypothetical protein VJG32_05020 [Anaerolineae bacterium]|nr:hypothetical protein [Anaerolineae bacterium]